MSKVKILDTQGMEAGVLDFPDEVLELRRGSQAVHDVVVAHQAEVRSGTASTLSVGDVAGSNKKPWKQKGTGRARAGSRRSSVWRGGGVAMGPHPRSYAKKVNRKVARLAFVRAMSEKIREGDVAVVEDLNLASGKTRDLQLLLNGWKLGSRVLFLVETPDAGTERAARNIPGVLVQRAGDVDVYTLLYYPKVIMTRAGAGCVLERMRTAKGRVA